MTSANSQHAGHHSAAPSVPAPYAGEQRREIKALSAQDQRGWTEGQGMGLAQAAELNGYPGPMHVLEHADSLKLTASQAAATRTLMQQHKAQVRALGVQLVQAERELDSLFREKRVSDEDIAPRTQQIATLQARIRASHLQTHVQQTKLLTAAQVDRYQILRGYQ
jgi:Spy/CpxP family protein refolding chaperone